MHSISFVMRFGFNIIEGEKTHTQKEVGGPKSDMFLFPTTHSKTKSKIKTSLSDLRRKQKLE